MSTTDKPPTLPASSPTPSFSISSAVRSRRPTPAAKRPATDDDPSPSTKRAESLDTTITLITPERIVFEYPLAGPFRRFYAYFGDLVIIFLIVLGISVASMLLTFGSAAGGGLILVGYFFVSWGYGILSETFLNGQTLGKKLVGIRVVTDQGVPITGAQAAVRNIVGTVDGLLPFFFLSGLCSMLLTKKFQRLGDLAAGTMVIVEQPSYRPGMIKVKDAKVDALLPWLPLQIAAGQDLSRALSDYVNNRPKFSHSVREEMAGPLAWQLRKRFSLPADSSADAILCAVYHRVFLGE